jgi:hypothetical protein
VAATTPAPLTADVGVLPEVVLAGRGPATEAFMARGVRDLRGAAECLRAIPYGRISDRERPLLTLAEDRGTCTTKHAALTLLAAEHDVDLALMLGVYEMSEANTPGVGRVLARHGLRRLPEAHCYVRWRGARVDITRAVAAAEPIERFLSEERIAPDQIGAYKIARHRELLATWLAHHRPAMTVDDAWGIREACIAAISDPR